MTYRAFPSPACLSVAMLVLSGFGHSEVHLVGGLGADSDEIAEAVAAAADGDVIRVRAGTYERFAVDDKELQIIGVEGAVVVNGLVRLRNMSQPKKLHISGIEFRGLDDEAMFLYDNFGQVLLQDCTILGKDAVPDYDQCVYALPAAAIEDCAQVALVDCSIRGGEGADAIDSDYYHEYCWAVHGASGLSIYDSNVALFGGDCRGGRGRDAYEAHHIVYGGNGGDGLFVGAASNVWVAGVLLLGGLGDAGTPERTFLYCGNGGRGGDAVELGQTAGGSNLRELGNTLFAGSGGPHGYFYPPDDPFPYCYDGPPGLPIRAAAGNTVVSLPGRARRIDAPTYVSSGDPLQLTVTGDPGDQVSLMLSPRDAFLARVRGILLLGPVRLGSVLPIGVIPASGVLNRTLPQLRVPVAGHRELGVQAWITPATGVRHLTNVRWVTIVAD